MSLTETPKYNNTLDIPPNDIQLLAIHVAYEYMYTRTVIGAGCTVRACFMVSTTSPGKRHEPNVARATPHTRRIRDLASYLAYFSISLAA